MVKKIIFYLMPIISFLCLLLVAVFFLFSMEFAWSENKISTVDNIELIINKINNEKDNSLRLDLIVQLTKTIRKQDYNVRESLDKNLIDEIAKFLEDKYSPIKFYAACSLVGIGSHAKTAIPAIEKEIINEKSSPQNSWNGIYSGPIPGEHLSRAIKLLQEDSSDSMQQQRKLFLDACLVNT